VKRLLVATPDKTAPRTIAEAFGLSRVDTVMTLPSVHERIGHSEYDFIMIDIRLLDAGGDPRMEGVRKELQRLWKANPNVEIIVLTPPERIREAVNVVKAGAGNYLTYPLNKDEIQYVIESLYESLKVQSELDYFRDESIGSDVNRLARLKSPAMWKVYEQVKLVAASNSTVLLLGETGTGKGVIARLIHTQSRHKDGPFISVHCGAIPDTLIESELFGHEKGSFTGAVRRKLGKFELGSGGTVFLDEIGTINQSMQIKLLQILQDKLFQRIGGDKDIPLEARIITASNVDLKQLSDRGEFRSDLYYRLNVFPIEIPPLRARREDIPHLAEHFLKRLNELHIKETHGIHPSVMDGLLHYDWPGNVRELENLMERAFLLETSHLLTPESFPKEIFDQTAQGTSIPLDLSLPLSEVRRRAMENVERSYLKGILGRFKGKVKHSAEHAGMTTRQLHNLMTRYGLRKEDFKKE
jgi:DNA-binding NtrC family response regulator